MHKFSITLLAIAILSCASAADGAITLALTKNPKPAPGLDSFTVRAVGTAGEVINSFAGINIAEGVHNVAPPFGQPATTINQWATDGANGASLAEWKIYDTYFLFDPSRSPSFGIYFIETNDGSDPAGLKLTNFGQNATEGLGAFRHILSTDQITIIPSFASSDVAFLQVVQPAGTTTYLDVVLYSNTGMRADFVDFAIGVPEPSSLVLGFLGLLGLAGKQRKRRFVSNKIKVWNYHHE